jgi:hypothetical protein
LRQWPFLTYETLKLLPVYVALVAARAEPVVPSTLEMLENHFEHLEVATYTIVVVVAPQFCTSRPILLLERGMAVLTTPWPALFHKPTQAFPDRLALDAPVPLACFGPLVGKSEKGKCTRAPCRSVAAWRPLERNQRRFLGMHGEAETDEAFRQDCHHPAGIGKASQKTVALPPGEDVLDKPFVQAMMQEYIG